MTKFKIYLGNETICKTNSISLIEKTNLENVNEYTPDTKIHLKPINKLNFPIYDIKFNEQIEDFLYKRMEECDSINIVEIFCEKIFSDILIDFFYFFSDCGIKNIIIFTNFEYKNEEINYEFLGNEEFFKKINFK
ncbi:hypothetical protein TUBRATIS_20300 [Tubulinosema ratisbonensis]|uniref:Uncharacterized protein n=1 Tax=Tubulinosema ratisbonensis TaxID=291195 RepID=A0A437AK05_9MICR|nr:hypothetical protein TUBRATIS_20300 [Tubulinosema ratisbonensis]